MEIKNYEVIELSNKINQHYQELAELKGAKFNHSLLTNIKILNNELSKLQDLLKSEKYDEYQDKRIEICEKYSEKDINDNPIKIKNEQGVDEFKIVEKNKNKFEKEIKTVQEKYKSVLENYKKRIDIYNESLNESVEIKFKSINIDDVPNDISFKLMEVISIFVK